MSENWERRFASILKETEENLSKVKNQLNTSRPNFYEHDLSEEIRPMESHNMQNHFSIQPGIVLHLTEKIDQQQQIIRQLEEKVLQIEMERQSDIGRYRSLESHLKAVDTRLRERGVDIETERKVVRLQDDVKSQLDMMRVMMQNFKSHGQSTATTDVDNRFQSFFAEVQALRNYIRDELGACQTDISAVRQRIGKLEIDQLAITGAQRDIDIRIQQMQKAAPTQQTSLNNSPQRSSVTPHRVPLTRPTTNPPTLGGIPLIESLSRPVVGRFAETLDAVLDSVKLPQTREQRRVYRDDGDDDNSPSDFMSYERHRNERDEPKSYEHELARARRKYGLKESTSAVVNRFSTGLRRPPPNTSHSVDNLRAPLRDQLARRSERNSRDLLQITKELEAARVSAMQGVSEPRKSHKQPHKPRFTSAKRDQRSSRIESDGKSLAKSHDRPWEESSSDESDQMLAVGAHSTSTESNASSPTHSKAADFDRLAAEKTKKYVYDQVSSDEEETKGSLTSAIEFSERLVNGNASRDEDLLAELDDHDVLSKPKKIRRKQITGSHLLSSSSSQLSDLDKQLDKIDKDLLSNGISGSDLSL